MKLLKKNFIMVIYFVMKIKDKIFEKFNILVIILKYLLILFFCWDFYVWDWGMGEWLLEGINDDLCLFLVV